MRRAGDGLRAEGRRLRGPGRNQLRRVKSMLIYLHDWHDTLYFNTWNCSRDMGRVTSPKGAASVEHCDFL